MRSGVCRLPGLVVEAMFRATCRDPDSSSQVAQRGDERDEQSDRREQQETAR